MPFKRHRQPKTDKPLNILLTNGRFPVTIDLARQIDLAGHHVYVVDCMHYHVCKFSVAVNHSYQTPVPREDPQGFIDAVKHAVEDAKIDLIIPMHEEIFFLVSAAQDNAELRNKLFAPPFKALITLHNKWEFSRLLERVGLDAPKAVLCKSMDDVKSLDRNVEWALKPVFGRASSKVFRIRPGEEPTAAYSGDVMDVDEENHYIAQEWMAGQRFCSYAVLQDGVVHAFAVYPVKDTIDGSSCVYFQSVDHQGIRAYVDKLTQHSELAHVSGQLAFDFIETQGEPEAEAERRLVAIECNPRATSGIHLFSQTTSLALAMTCRPNLSTPCPDISEANSSAVARPGTRRQLAPGMLMWKRTKEDRMSRGVREYVRHMARLMSSKDVMFSTRDFMPTLMQPFLLTSYYEICRERKLKLPVMFQWDVTWEPKGEELRKVRTMFETESPNTNGKQNLANDDANGTTSEDEQAKGSPQTI